MIVQNWSVILLGAEQNSNNPKITLRFPPESHWVLIWVYVASYTALSLSNS